METTANRRQGQRVAFAKGIEVQIFAIDGTWRRACTMLDVSNSGARLLLKSSIEGLNLKEFFLVLSSTGMAFRRCGLAWINGDQIGANFLTEAPRPDKKRSVETVAADG